MNKWINAQHKYVSIRCYDDIKQMCVNFYFTGRESYAMNLKSNIRRIYLAINFLYNLNVI